MRTRNVWLDLSLMGFMVVFLTSIFMSMPTNILSTDIPVGVRDVVTRVMPQGWAFFTRDPQSEMIGAYRLSSTQTPENALMTPQGRVENLWGLSRNQRAQGPEMASLANEVSEWTECDEDSDVCLDNATDESPLKVENSSPAPTLCGDIIIAQETPVPWSYRDFDLGNTKVEKTALLSVTCLNGGL